MNLSAGRGAERGLHPVALAGPADPAFLSKWAAGCALTRRASNSALVSAQLTRAESKKVSATVLNVKYPEAPLRTQRHACHD